MSKFIKTALATIALLPALASAEIYRWVDENGKVHYSDKAPSGVKVEKRTYSNVATPFRKAPSDLYLKEEDTEVEEGEDSTDQQNAADDTSDTGATEEQNTDQEDQTIDEDLLTDEEKAEKAKKEEEEYKKLQDQYKKVKDDYRKARKERSAKSE